MRATRAATLVSIVGGGALGAAAAMYGSNQRPPIRQIAESVATARPLPSPPAEPEAELEPSPAPSPPVFAADSTAPDAALSAWGEPPTDFDSLSTTEAETFCGVRSLPHACLAAARAYDASDATKARTFRLLALSQFIDRCTAREPEACEELAKLYDQGVAVPENMETPYALRARVRELCADRTTPFCMRPENRR